ncbi:MAG TPA: flagellar motor switch protein FliN [Bryobacteraceae bacterium]|nr:flagellar motor switch protein FliN [Bryobacteraceae bacterium]
MQNGSPSPHDELKGLLEELFSKSLAQSIASMTGEEADVTAGSVFGSESSLLWFGWNLNPESYGALCFGGPKQPWVDLGKKILSMGDDEAPDAELIDSTLSEIASQVAGSITTFLNHQYQRQIETGPIRTQEATLPVEPGVSISFHQVRFGDGSVIPVSFRVPESLFQSLIPVKKQQEAPAPSEATAEAGKLERLFDVEMPVSISIGRAKMPLKDVVKLTTGSVVELSRSISEPVDIVVNNCVVARGDVVVVEGNFGVRIREILSKEDRMRQLTSSQN